MEPVDLRGEALAPAAGRLLVAGPMLVDPNFAHTIVLLLDADDDGVLGVVLNRPSEVEVPAALEGWRAAVGSPAVLFRGGPVATDSALAVGTLRAAAPIGGAGAPGTDPVGWRPLFDGTGLVDLDAPTEVVLPALSTLRIFAGYAGWSPGQLEAEIDEGAWYVVEGASSDLNAVDGEELWRRVLRRQRGPLAWLATYPSDPTEN